MATRKQIAAARRNIKKAQAARHSGRKSGGGRKSGRKSGGGRRSACVAERWSGPCRSRAGTFKSC
jgi:hypothetical protein